MSGAGSASGAYGPAAAEIERLVVRLEALEPPDWREMVARAQGVPGLDAALAELDSALVAGRLGGAADRAAARLRSTVESAAFTHVKMDPALNPVPVGEATEVISTVARALVARENLGASALAALYAPLESLVPRARIAAASEYGPGGSAVKRFVDGLSHLNRHQWRTVEERRLSESRGPSAEENEALLSAARQEAEAAAQGADAEVEVWLSARADARAAAAHSWDRSGSGETSTQREEFLVRAQLACGALVVREATPEWVVDALCGLFAGVVDLPPDVAAVVASRDHRQADRLFVRGSQELEVPLDVLDQRLDDPRRLWLSTLGVRERNGQHDLEVGFGAGPARVALSVSLDIGAAEASTNGTFIPLTWEPVTGGRILPGFQGELSVQAKDASRSELRIEGDYRPPLGELGRVLDESLMHRVAEATIHDLVRRVARALLET